MSRHQPLLILALLLVAPPARGSNELSVRVSTAFPASGSGFYAVSDSSRLVEGEFVYARLARLLGPARLWFEGAYMISRHDDAAFGVPHQLVLHRFTAGVRGAVPLPWAPWIQPHVRVGLGVAAGEYELTRLSTSDWAAAFSGHLLGGVELLIPRRFLHDPRGTGFTAGVVLEGGLSFTTPLRFVLAPERPEGEIHTPQSGAALGSLDLTAGVVRVGVVFRF